MKREKRSSYLETLLLSGLGIGYLPVARGTAASALPAALAGLAFWLGVQRILVFCFLIFTLVLFGGATFAFGSEAEKRAGEKDPPEVVSDEIAGQSLGLLTSVDPLSCFISFIIFRALDALKPWPIKRFEKIGGGVGILADDLAAGFLTALTFFLVNF